VIRFRLDRETWLYRGIADHPDARAGVVRWHLAEALGCDAATIVLGRDSAGKPYLATPAVPLWFNTAGRDGLLAVATSRRGPVGVDVETLAHCRDTAGLTRTVFSPGEADWLERQPAELRPLSFARLWTAKEAVLKACGTGIAGGLAEPDFSRYLIPPRHRIDSFQLDGEVARARPAAPHGARAKRERPAIEGQQDEQRQWLVDTTLAPPWPAVVAKLAGTPYTVAWYTSTVDEAFVIAAQAQAETGHLRMS